jgi:hypothetical protein
MRGCGAHGAVMCGLPGRHACGAGRACRLAPHAAPRTSWAHIPLACAPLSPSPAQTPLALLKRFQSGSGLDDLRQRVLPRWQPWQPPKLDQALQQGGVFVFDGDRVVFSHYDQATGAHADLSSVVGLVQGLVTASEAGAASCAAGAAGGQ